ncbi:TerC family protein [Geminocystis sp. CENA526]|uniref:TerC family protein n=1 Tax=Geminocystis sp. CENA526 TaxID=1355871 RepID=UPI003D6DFEB3
MLDQILHPSIDFGIETAFILIILVALEAVLSADNAIALASIAQGLTDEKEQNYALNIGLLMAYVLRMLLIVTATWIIKYWQFSLLGGLYLLWLTYQYFSGNEEKEEGEAKLSFKNLWQAIPMIAFTDLAFSLDSVTTAIAVADEIWLIIAGGTIGVIALRFLAQLFIRWIEEFTHLQDAGFITVGLVGLRLIIKVIYPNIVPPEWLMISIIIGMFVWGFSKKNEVEISK